VGSGAGSPRAWRTTRFTAYCSGFKSSGCGLTSTKLQRSARTGPDPFVDFTFYPGNSPGAELNAPWKLTAPFEALAVLSRVRNAARLARPAEHFVSI
jgi:hypothetical protein